MRRNSDLPEPVVPPTSTCGPSRQRSITNGPSGPAPTTAAGVGRPRHGATGGGPRPPPVGHPRRGDAPSAERVGEGEPRRHPPLVVGSEQRSGARARESRSAHHGPHQVGDERHGPGAAVVDVLGRRPGPRPPRTRAAARPGSAPPRRRAPRPPARPARERPSPALDRGTTSRPQRPGSTRADSPASGRPEPTASDGATGHVGSVRQPAPPTTTPGRRTATDTDQLVGGMGRAQLPDQPGEQAVGGRRRPDDAEAAPPRRGRRRAAPARPRGWVRRRSLDPGDAGGHLARAQPHPGGPAAPPEPGEPLLGGRQDGRRVGMGAVEPLRLAAQRVGRAGRAPRATAAACAATSRRCARPAPHRSPRAPASSETGPERREEQQLRPEEEGEGDRHRHRGHGRDPRDARRDAARAVLRDSGSRLVRTQRWRAQPAG